MYTKHTNRVVDIVWWPSSDSNPRVTSKLRMVATRYDQEQVICYARKLLITYHLVKELGVLSD